MNLMDSHTDAQNFGDARYSVLQILRVARAWAKGRETAQLSPKISTRNVLIIATTQRQPAAGGDAVILHCVIRPEAMVEREPEGGDDACGPVGKDEYAKLRLGGQSSAPEPMNCRLVQS